MAVETEYVDCQLRVIQVIMKAVQTLLLEIWKNVFQEIGPNKQAGVAILISDKHSTKSYEMK